MKYICDRFFCRPSCFFVLLLFALSVSSCHSPVIPEPAHLYHFDPLFIKADSLDPDHKGRGLDFVDSVYNTFPSPGPGDLYKKYDYKRHYFYETRKDYPKAMIYVDSQLLVIRAKAGQSGFIEDYGRALFSKGDILLAERKQNEAFLNYYQGKQAIEKTVDSCLFGDYSGRLGVVCYRQGRYREAVGYFKEAFDDLGHCTGKDAFNRFVYQQGNLDNIALCYGGAGLMDSAMYYYDSTLRYIGRNGAQYLNDETHRRFIETAEGVVYGNEGDVYYKKGDLAAAEALFLKSVRINVQKEHANEDAQLTRCKLIRVYLETGRLKEAGMVLGQLRLSLDSLPGDGAEMQWRQLEWRYNDSMRQIPQAYRYLQSYLRLKDSMDAGNQPANLNEELQHIAQGYELDLLKKQDEMKTVYLVIAIVFFFMALAIILLVVQNWKRSRKNVAGLTDLNQRIVMQNDHMQKTLSALEQSQRENTRMMKIVAHDLRSPIGASGTIAGMLLKKEDLPRDQRQLLELIRTASQNSLELITDLLHVDTNPEAIKKEPVDMQTTLTYCVELLQFKAESKKQRLLLKTEPLTMLVNREKIWRVISNLITNAMKFSPEGTDIDIDMARTGDRLRISVKDRGIGIPEEMKDKIFDMFTEAKRRGTAGEESFGLGLSISKQIVEAHGGKIWYEPAREGGTIFYIELPAKIDPM
ncbi:MAG TPA: HAMP domain-containing sensor histidine kinase [Puia sp.]|nr:HAMP domain-containing sensor histidine kinase [Puia sp.]